MIERIYGPEILAVSNEFFAQLIGRRRMRQADSGIVNLFRELRWLPRRGHYVIALDWTPLASLGAHSVTKPPIALADAAEIVLTFQRLGRDTAFRQELVAAQGAWFGRTFQARDRSKSDGPFMERLTSMLDR